MEALSRPDVNRQTARVVKDGFHVGELDPDGGGQIVALNLGFSFLERPWDVVQARADGMAGAVGTEETGSLGQKIFKRAGAQVG